MTLADSIVTIAQTLLRNRGQWAPIVPGATPHAFVRAVADTASLLDISDSSIIAAAMVELRRRATPYPNPNALERDETRRPLAQVTGDLIDAYEEFMAVMDSQGAMYAAPQAETLQSLLQEINNDHPDAAHASIYLATNET